MKKRIRKITLIVGVNFMVLAIVLELVGTGWYYLKYRQLFQFRAPELAQTQSEPVRLDLVSRLHPYYGYVNSSRFLLRSNIGWSHLRRLREGEDRPADWLNISSNNQGFVSRHEYPYHKSDPSEFVVGVFGGSVANYLTIQSARRLKARLAQIPELSGRKIVVLNFSLDGSRHPQQLQILNHYLILGQRFDLVINVDGFNEVVAGLRNVSRSVDSSMPSIVEFAPLLNALRATGDDADGIRDLRRFVEARWNMQRLNEWSQSCRSAGLYLLLRLWHRYEQRIDRNYGDGEEVEVAEAMLEALPYTVTSTELKPDSEEALDRLMEQWRNAVIAMHGMAQKRGIQYLQILQPNQYFSSKSFTDTEKRFALVNHAEGSHPEPDYVSRGFARFPQFMDELAAAGVEIESAISLFDSVEETVYIDACCHINQRGNDLLADFVAAAVGESSFEATMP